MAHRLLFAFALAGCGLITACGGGGDAPVTVPDAVTFNVGGQLAGLGAGKSLVLAHVDGAGAAVQRAALNTNGAYSLRLSSGTAYNLRVLTQPAGQTCTVSNGTGTASADVNNISVNCMDDAVPPEAKTISGSVGGLGAGKSLVLQLTANGSTQETTVNTDGNFSFPQAITGSYLVTVKTMPAGQSCTVANGQGTAGEGPAVGVTCASVAFKLGGTVIGNLGIVALRDSASGETLTLNSNGAFSFTQPVLQGSAYSVAVFDQSAIQVCSVANGSGTATADVGNIQVSCQAIAVVSPPKPPAAVPSVPTGLTMTYDVKSFKLAWGTVAAPAGGGAVSYKLFEDADGPGPAASTQIGGTLASSNFTHVVSALLHTRLNAQYRVQACNTSGCSAASAAITPNLTQAIGFFKASNTGADDRFGHSVALSADGSTLAVGAVYEASNATGVGGNQADDSLTQAGAVYVFTRTGGVWAQQAYLKASNTESFDEFGYRIALSADGSTLAVSANVESSNASGVNGNQTDNSEYRAGAVYIFSRTAGAWSQQAYVKASNAQTLDSFSAVALSGDGNTLAVGAFGEDSSATSIDGDQSSNAASGSGAVYVFVRAAGVWSQQAYLKAANAQGGDSFGISVGLSADGNTLAAGAYGQGGGSGAAYVFTRAGSTWSQQAFVKASNPSPSAFFGFSLGLAADGNTLALGAILEDSSATGIDGNQANNSAGDSGAVYVFARAAGVWSQQAYVKASNTGPADIFGFAVALSADGSTLAVAAYTEGSNAIGIDGDQANNVAPNSGAAYVFGRSGGVWSQRAYVKASNVQSGDLYGSSIALSGDGNTLAVGAPYERSSATGINGDQADNSTLRAGAVFVY